MSYVRWGVLSTAAIGIEKVIPAMQQGKYCKIEAISSRSLEKAQKCASELNIPKAYGSYEELLADEAIDAVYNPLPNHLHVPMSIMALEAGKHVLCEKPIALSSAEAETLVEAGRKHPKLKLMEAFMYRHHPQWVTTRRLVDEGKIGELSAIQSIFSYYNDDGTDIRNKVETGGGAIMDIGCYPISLSRFIFGAEPDQVFAYVDRDPRFKTDRLSSGIMNFGRGNSSFVCSTQMSGFQRTFIIGTQGSIELEIPFNAPPDKPTKILHKFGTDRTEIVLDACDQYTVQGDLFSRAVLEDTEVPTPIEDAVANMRVIEALFRSGEKKQWETL